MKAEINYYNPKNETKVTKSGFRYLDTNPVITQTEIWNDTKDEIFKRFDSENNSLRYCNGSYLKFKEEETQNEYIDWYKGLSEATKFKMYYGNGIVD